MSCIEEGELACQCLDLGQIAVVWRARVGVISQAQILVRSTLQHQQGIQFTILDLTLQAVQVSRRLASNRIGGFAGGIRPIQFGVDVRGQRRLIQASDRARAIHHHDMGLRIPTLSTELYYRWDKSGNGYQRQEDDGADNETALGYLVFVLASDNQANIAPGIPSSSIIGTDRYGLVILYLSIFFWRFYGVLRHRFV